jgi:hypothetical protein
MLGIVRGRFERVDGLQSTDDRKVDKRKKIIDN